MGITIGQLTAIITADSTQFETRMKSVSDLLNKASGDAGNTSQSISAMSVAIGNMVAQAANKIFDMGKSIIETGIKFDALKEQATVAFTTMLGSGQKAKAFLDDLAAFANKTPFEFPDLIRAAQKFTAMGVSAGKVIPTLTAVGDAVAAMGGGKEMIDRVSTALVQMSAKGKVSAEEMRQLAEAGIPAWDILAKKLGISVPEAMKKSEKGAIDATTAIDALVEGMESRFGGMMDKQALTFNGLLSTLHDTAVQMAGQMFEPIFEASKDVLSKIVSGLPAFQAEFAKAWNEIVKDAGFILSELKPTISNILSDIKTLWSSNQKDIINEVHTASSIVKTLWDSSMGGLLKIFSAGTAALTGNWTEAMNRIVAGTSLAGSKVMATIGRWIQALVTVSNLTGGLGSIANIFGKISGPAGDVKPDTFWKDATTALRAHTAAANQAAVEVPKALGAVGGAHKKAADESGKLLKEQVSAVNDWLKSTDSALSISETAWENAEQSVRTTLLKASNAFHKSIDDTQTWAATLQAAFIEAANGDLGKALIVKLKGTKILIENPLIDVSSNVADVAKEIGARRITAQDLIDAENIKTATKRTMDDWVSIQTKAQDEAVTANAKYQAELQKQADANSRTMRETAIKMREAIKDELGEGIGSVLLGLADKFHWHLGKVKGWADDVSNIIGTMPGKFGDAARKVASTLNQWLSFGNSVLSMLNRVFGQGVPSSMDGLFSSIINIFKGDKATNQVGAAVGGLVKSATQSATAAATTAGQAAGTAVTNGISSSIAGGAGSAVSALGSIFTAITGAVNTFASTFHDDSKSVRFAGGFLLGGPVGGILAAIFGGPSEFEKQKRALQLDQLKANVESIYEDIKSKMIETMQKGAELLKTLEGYVDVPRKAIKHFLNQLFLVLEMFVDMSKEFKADGLEAGKAVVENLGGAFDFLLSGATLIEAIKNLASITDKNIADFIATTTKVISKWLAAASEIELGAAKFTGKISDKLKTSFEFLKIVPEVIKGIAESATVDDAAIDGVFATAQKIVSKMKALSEDERGLALNKAAASSERFRAIFDSIKTAVEAIKAVADVGNLEDSIWGKFQAYIETMVNTLSESLRLMDTASTLAANFKGLADSIKENTLAGIESIKAVAGALAALLGGGKVGVTANVTYGGALGSVGTPYIPTGKSIGRGDGQISGATVSGNTFNVMVDLSKYRHLDELIEDVTRLFGRGGSLATAAQSV